MNDFDEGNWIKIIQCGDGGFQDCGFTCIDDPAIQTCPCCGGKFVYWYEDTNVWMM